MSASIEGRFVGVSQAETDAFVESMKNPNTKRKTNSDTHIFMEWLIANNETRLPEEIEKQNLHMYLARFWLSVRSKKKEEYDQHEHGMLMDKFRISCHM
jgi:hypothetical protein